MGPAPLPALKRDRECIGPDLASHARQANELGAAAKELGRAALIGRDVSLGMTQHRTPGRREMGDRQSIGGGPGWRQKNRHFALEKLGKALLHTSGQGVIAVSKRRALVRRRDGRKNLRRHPGRIVARKVHVPVRSIAPFRSAKWHNSRTARELTRYGRSPRPFGFVPASPLPGIASGDQIRVRLTLVSALRIWHGALGQYYCPSWRFRVELLRSSCPAEGSRVMRAEPARHPDGPPCVDPMGARRG